MGSISWNRMKHDVKVNILNEQHKALFNTLDALYKAMEDKSDKKALAKVIDELIAYSIYHSQTEENLLEKYNYPELSIQKEQHKFFIEKVEKFRAEFENHSFMLYFDMAMFFKSWIANHIEGLDRKYAKFLNDNGIF